jgi:type I restriction enzyme M protein
VASLLIPLDENAVQVFTAIHKKLCAIDGLLPDEALVQFCHLITIKIYDEQLVDDGLASRFKTEIDDSYALLLADNIRALYRLVNEGRSLDSGLALSNAAILEAVSLLQDHSITETDADLIGCAFQAFINKLARQMMGQYFTPDLIVNFIVDVMAPSQNDKIIDPFSGTRNILLKTLIAIKSKQSHHDATAYQKTAFKKLHGIEKNQRINSLSTIYDLTRDEAVFNVDSADALADFADLSSSFMPVKFDLVMNNPPFGSHLSAREIEKLGDFELASGGTGVPIEVLALERSLQFLKDGGRFAIIIPDGLLSGKLSRRVRTWLAKHVKLMAVISLPIETFTNAGAAVKTSLLVGTKRIDPLVSTEEDYDIFLGKIDVLGDSASDLTNGNVSEIESVKNALLAFIVERGW